MFSSADLEAKPAAASAARRHSLVHGGMRKGDIVGVYKSFGDCQAQLSSLIFDPPISVYKGYSLPKDTEEYLGSCGLTNAIHTIAAADLKDDIFWQAYALPFSTSLQGGATVTDALKRRSHEVPASDNLVSS
ncbi:unnamed protein product [Prunus armeniaca]|uniref:Uncharacterized protein n=1 Tax=Prunus armeniaca TaxID=36596 RepID=A0A6J5TKX4_PRUAR|nr:unnamed protein product [Prunus armeniaca]